MTKQPSAYCLFQTILVSERPGTSWGRISDVFFQYMANGLSAGRHELAITANPSSLGEPQVFNVDSIRVLSGNSSSGPVILPLGSPNTGTSSTLSQPVSTGSIYPPVLSSTVFSTSTSLPTSTSLTISPSLMPSSSFTPPVLLPTASFGR